MLDYEGSGMSVMEMTHRSKTFLEIIREAERLLRELMNVPLNYKILFLQGGATLQFSAVPMNLYRKGKADYIITGQWAKKAADEGARYLEARCVSTSKDKNFTYIPADGPEAFDGDADYCHFTTNNTVYGTRFASLPETRAPLVADMSSCILSEVYDVSKFGLIYAGAQKNIGPAGLTVVIVREDLIGNALPSTPLILDYKTHADDESLHNTPPTYAVYIAMLMFRWLKEQGGVAAMQRQNEAKAKLLYDCIDGSSFYESHIAPRDRSLMNILFFTRSEELDKKFVKEATAEGLVSLGGYRTVGGMRASVYNAMPYEGVEKLVGFMKDFEAKNSR